MDDFISLVDWSRAQFALTAMYHWVFVPLTLGLSFMMAFMETKYVITGDEFWKKTTKFWMNLFAVNFAVGIATGLILEFEFGTNWSNYSYFVGDIFGAPLAIEGIFAFFMEATFVAVMFFGWKKVSKKFHLVSTWLVAIGASLSALWILVANAWMQSPVGVHFNPEMGRNEMASFWEVLFSPVAMNKFSHTVTSGFVLAAVFVIGVSAWFLIKGREKRFATQSIKIASVFGLLGILLTIYTGHGSAQQVARVQPMKLAAMEGLYDGRHNAPTEVIPGIEIPGVLSWLSYGNTDAFVAGINDLVKGNEEQGIMSAEERMERGRIAKEQYMLFREAFENGDTAEAERLGAQFQDEEFLKEYFAHFGYGSLREPTDIIPPLLGLNYWSFRIMVGGGFFFILLFALSLWFEKKDILHKQKWWLHISMWSILLVYIVSQCGWIIAEVGRQPWIIQDLMPTTVAVTHIDKAAVQTTFWVFAVLFTIMLAAAITIMIRQIRKGPKAEELQA